MLIFWKLIFFPERLFETPVFLSYTIQSQKHIKLSAVLSHYS